MRTHRPSLLHLFVVPLVLGAALLLFSPAFAQDELPPAELPAAPAEAPAEQPAPEGAADEPQAASLYLSGGEGDALPLASEDGPSILANQACYTVGGSESCFASVTLALTNITTTGVLPSDRKIHLENGSLAGFTLNGTASILSQINGVIGAGTDSDPTVPDDLTTVTSAITVQNVGSFTLQGMVINGAVNLLNNTGKITVKDVKVKNTAGTGITINGTGSVEFDQVDSSNNNTDGAVVETSTTGTVTIRNSNFSNNGDDGLIIDTAGAITLNLVNVSNNTDKGLESYNDGGKKPVSITSSVFSFNGDTGISVDSRGAITLKTTNASNNTGKGAELTNDYSDATGGVTVQRSQFNDNTSFGLDVDSFRAILLDGVNANGNVGVAGARGAYLDNSTGSGSITIKDSLGANTFNENGPFGGLSIISNGAVSITGVIANNNQGDGASISANGTVNVNNSTFTINNNNGVDVLTSGAAITLKNIVASNNVNGTGAYLDNAAGTIPGKPVSVTQGVFNENNDAGLLIVSYGAVTLTSITANYTDGNGVGVDGSGVYIDNKAGGKGVTIKSGNTPNAFNGNNIQGVYIESSGAVSVTNAAFSLNQTSGLQVDNSFGTANVTLSNLSAFDNNENGILAISRGSITAKSVTAISNSARGMWLSNDSDTDYRKPVSVSNSQLNRSGLTGLSVDSYGAITLANVSASQNNNNGVTINGSGSFKNPLTVKGSSLGASVFTDNAASGFTINSSGAATFTNIIFESNAQFGLNSNGISTGDIKVVNSQLLNNADGARVRGTGNILVDRMVVQGNTSSGLVLDNTFGDPADKKGVTVYRTSLYNNMAAGLDVKSKFNITLNGVTAQFNLGRGILLNNSVAGDVIISSGFMPTVASTNSGNGIEVVSGGSVTVSKVTSTRNIGRGLDIIANSPTGNVKITSSNFSDNTQIGLNIVNAGSIFLDKVDASSNNSGAILDNRNDNTGTKTVTVQRSTFSANVAGLGLQIQSDNNVLLNAITASDNYGGISHGIWVNTTTGTGDITLNSSYGSNMFNGNEDFGAQFNAGGKITLSKIIASGNGVSGNWSGLYVTTLSNNPVTVTCGVFNGNGRNGVQASIGTGTLTLKGVTAIGNDQFGGAVDPNLAYGSATLVLQPATCGSW